jgi:hypothetical protein
VINNSKFITKMMSPIMASILSRQKILNSPITILPMFLAREFSHTNEDGFLLGLMAFFAGFEGVFMGLDYGKSRCSGFWLWE